MIEAFVITLREGVEAALAVCLILAYLRKSGQAGLVRPVYLGLSVAALLSLGGAVAVRLTGFNPDGVVEGIVLLASAGLVTWLVVWMWSHGKKMKQVTERKLGEILARPTAGQKAGLFFFTFIMVFREGVESIVMLWPVTFTSDAVLAAAGGVSGIALAVGFGVSFLRGSLRIDLRKFFAVTTVVLLVFVVQLILAGLHEFAEAGLLPVSGRYMGIAGPLLRHNVLFILAVLALPFVLLIGSSLKAASNGPVAANPAEDRKRRALGRSERAARIAFSVLAVVCIFALGAHFVYGKRELKLTEPALLEAKDGVVRVPLSDLEGKKLRRYGVVVDGVLVRFLAMRLDKERVGAGLDACDICGDFGYVQQSENLICLNCVAEIPADSLGKGHGCSPVPLHSKVKDEALEILLSDLASQKNRFEHSKVSFMATCPGCGMQFRLEEAGGAVNGVPHCKMPGCRERLLSTSPH